MSNSSPAEDSPKPIQANRSSLRHSSYEVPSAVADAG
jgi:hypothetical protein